MDSEVSAKSKPRDVGVPRLWAAIRHIPQSYRLAAFTAVFGAIILFSFVGSVIARDGLAFLTSPLMIGLGAMVLAGLAVLYAIPRAQFAGHAVGAFFLLPLSYAVLVLTLAIADRASSGGTLTVTSPVANATLLGGVDVDWEPAEPAQVTISHGGRTVRSSTGFILPPVHVKLDARQGYQLVLQSEAGEKASIGFNVEPDPRVVSLRSVYRPPSDFLAKKTFLDGNIAIPRGFSITATVDAGAYGSFRLLGTADQKYAERCGLRRARGGDMCSYVFLHIPVPADSGIVVSVAGVVFDRTGKTHPFEHEVAPVFDGKLATVQLDVEHDGAVRMRGAPGS